VDGRPHAKTGGRAVQKADGAYMVYVVDDDDAVRDSVAALLEPEGFAVRLFSSADQFLDDLDEIYPVDGGSACLLLDLNMPGKDGHVLLETLSKRNCTLPVVVMTGNVDERTRMQALKNGALAFLEKPADADQLIDTLRKALARYIRKGSTPSCNET
jgi:FixJ family two-component response regulator